MVQTKTKTKKKSFSAKLTKEEKFYGRYMGGSPFQAASKALTEILRRGEIKPGKQIVFCLKEITQKSANKRHFYLGERVKLDEAVVYTVDGNEIRKEYKNQIRKLRNNELDKWIDDLELAGGAKKKTATKKTTKKVTAKKTSAKTVKGKVTKATKVTKTVKGKATKATKSKVVKKAASKTKATTKAVKGKVTKKATKATKGKGKKTTKSKKKSV
jgi:hypothetical protein